MLHNQLVSLFSEIEFSEPIEYTQLDIHDLEVDIIFTTKHLETLLDINIPVVQVSPIMNLTEKQAL